MDENKHSNEKYVKWLKTVMWFLAVPLFAIFALYLNKTRLDALLNSRVAAMRKKNCPTDFNELREWYANGGVIPKKGAPKPIVNDEENAAIPFKKAFSLIVDDVFVSDPHSAEFADCAVKDGKLDFAYIAVCGFYTYERYFRRTPLPPKVVTTSTAYLKVNQPALREIEKGLRGPRCFSPELCDLSSFITVLAPRRSIVRLFSLRSMLAVEKGDDAEAVRSACEACAFLEKFKKEPYLITALVNMACQGMITRNVEWILNKVRLNDKQLRKISQCVGRSFKSVDLSSAYKTEAVLVLSKENEDGMIEIISTLFTHDPRMLKKVKTGLGFVLNCTGLMSDFKLAALDLNDVCLRASKRSYLDSKKIFKKYWADLSYIDGTFYQMRTLSKGYGMSFRSNALCLAETRICRTVLAVERFRLKYGKLPSSLYDFVPEFMDGVPIDPFDGKLLKYKKGSIKLNSAVRMTKKEVEKHSSSEENGESGEKVVAWNEPTPGYKLVETRPSGYMVYSVGDDGKDNGGTPYRQYGPGSDLTFMIAR